MMLLWLPAAVPRLEAAEVNASLTASESGLLALIYCKGALYGVYKVDFDSNSAGDIRDLPFRRDESVIRCRRRVPRSVAHWADWCEQNACSAET